MWCGVVPYLYLFSSWSGPETQYLSWGSRGSTESAWKAVRSVLTFLIAIRLLVAGEREYELRNKELTWCSFLPEICDLWFYSPPGWLYSQGKRDLNPRPECLVLQPVSSLHDGEVSGEEDGAPLRHSHRGRHLTVVGVWGEAGSKRCQNRESAEDVPAALGPTLRIFCEVIRLLSDEQYEVFTVDGNVSQKLEICNVLWIHDGFYPSFHHRKVALILLLIHKGKWVSIF